ncbi:MAG TPA: AAA family ATPase [Caulobacteraceae bacterium]|jgi:chloramphenicol 3-O phosphotransferase
MTHVVLLNGPSSVGKTSLAKALQAAVGGPLLHVQMDVFLEMLPAGVFGHSDYFRFETTTEDGHPVTAIHSGPHMARVLSGMRRAVAAMAADGLDLVVDDVFWGDELADYRALLAPFDFHAVAVTAPLEVLEARERERGDRVLGLARWQRARMAAEGYDLAIDNAALAADAAAALIKARFGL